MRRLIQQGHAYLPVAKLPFGDAQWAQLHDAVQGDHINTRALRHEQSLVADSLALLQSNLEQLEHLLEQPPSELTCDQVRLLVAAARRVHLHDLADELAYLFDHTPGVLK